MIGSMLTVNLMQRERGVNERGESELITIKVPLFLPFQYAFVSKNHLTGCPAPFLEERYKTSDKAEWSEITSVEGGRETASCLMVSLMP